MNSECTGSLGKPFLFLLTAVDPHGRFQAVIGGVTSRQVFPHSYRDIAWLTFISHAVVHGQYVRLLHLFASQVLYIKTTLNFFSVS